MQTQLGSTKISILVIILIIVGGVVLAMNKKDSAENVNESQNPANTKAKPVVMTINAQNNSGQTGTVTLSDVENGGTKVVIEVPSAGAGVSQPAHIHVGNCDALGAIRYELNYVVEGRSETILPPALHFIHGLGQSAINIHKSTAEYAKYAACGDLTAALNAANHK